MQKPSQKKMPPLLAWASRIISNNKRESPKCPRILAVINSCCNISCCTSCLIILISLIVIIYIWTECCNIHGYIIHCIIKILWSCLSLQEFCKPSPPQKPLPADPWNKTARFNSVSRAMLGFPKPVPQTAPVGWVWLFSSVFPKDMLLWFFIKYMSQ